MDSRWLLEEGKSHFPLRVWPLVIQPLTSEQSHTGVYGQYKLGLEGLVKKQKTRSKKARSCEGDDVDLRRVREKNSG